MDTGAGALAACGWFTASDPGVEQPGRNVRRQTNSSINNFMSAFLDLLLRDSLQENRYEGMDDFFTIVRVCFFKAENLLPQNKAGKHPEKPACGQLRIDWAENALVDTFLNVVCNGIAVRHAGDEHVRQLMTFQGAEQEKAVESCVLFVLFQECPADSFEKRLIVARSGKLFQFLDARIAVLPGLVF